MSRDDSQQPRDSGGTQQRSANSVQSAIDKLESAIEELARSARDDLSGRASDLIDEATRRIRSVQAGEYGSGRRRRRRRRHSDEASVQVRMRAEREDENDATERSDIDDWRWLPKSRGLYRDARNGRIGGVCAGFARYFGIERWVARLIALTGLLFMPSIVFPGYWIAYFIMRRRGPDLRPERVASMRHDHRSPAPEFGARHSPRRSLRQIHADLTDAELKLRRLEKHVTSDQYFLRRELDALDQGAH